MKRRGVVMGLGAAVGTVLGTAIGARRGVGAAGWVSAAGTAAAPAQALQWRRRELLGFGTVLKLLAAHREASRADAALDAVVVEIRAIEAEMSLFDPASDLSRLNRQGVLQQPGARLLEVLQLAQRVARHSEGAFDVTVQPLWALWSAAAEQGRLPNRREIQQARARVGWQMLELGPERLRLTRPGMAVTLNGIAQGYAARRARDLMRAHGIEHALLDTGEWSMRGRNPQSQPWTLGIAAPGSGPEPALVARVLTDGRCMATSADDATVFTSDRRHHHIFDPRLGDSPAQLSGVSVLAEDGALADALTKVFFVAGWDRVDELAQTWGVDALVVDKHGRWRASSGLRPEVNLLPANAPG